MGDSHEVKLFSTWCAKAIALIGALPATLQDRAVALQLERRRKNEPVERRRADRNADLDELCRKTARWAADNSNVLRECDPVVPNDLDDRAADNWRALLAIAEAVGPSWAEKARAAASVLSGKRDESEETPGVMLLRDSRGILNERVPFLSPSRLVEELVKIEEAPWSEWRNGKPISAKGVANLLKPYGLRSELDREDKVPGRRYYRDKFKPARERYLPEDPQKSVATVASVTSPVNAGNFG